MRIMTYFSAKDRAEMKIELYQSKLPPTGNAHIWKLLIKAIRQRNKFTSKLILLIQKADGDKK